MASKMFNAAENLSRVLQNPSATVSGGIEAATMTVLKLNDSSTDERLGDLWKDMTVKIKEYS